MNTITTIRLEGVEVYDAGDPRAATGAEGEAHYELAHPDGTFDFMRQPFVRGRHRLGTDRQPIWGWDGNGRAPTLTPSFDAWVAPRGRPGVHAHLYLTGGVIDLLPDSTCIRAGGAS